MYFSRSDQGTVTVDVCSMSELYTTQIDFVDGGHLESYERPEQVAPGRDIYEYRERPVSRVQGHVVSQARVRSGHAVARRPCAFTR